MEEAPLQQLLMVLPRLSLALQSHYGTLSQHKALGAIEGTSRLLTSFYYTVHSQSQRPLGETRNAAKACRLCTNACTTQSAQHNGQIAIPY